MYLNLAICQVSQPLFSSFSWDDACAIKCSENLSLLLNSTGTSQ